MEEIHIRKVKPEDRSWVQVLLTEQWGSTVIITRGTTHSAADLPGYIAESNNKKVGLITYRLDGEECELITLDSLEQNKGIGGKLIENVIQVAQTNGCKRVWLITTNDNLNALRFYQKKGFILSALYPNALDQARKLKPEIPLVGIDKIPLRDEIELEYLLT